MITSLISEAMRCKALTFKNLNTGIVGLDYATRTDVDS
jgi:hypothetical protein